MFFESNRDVKKAAVRYNQPPGGNTSFSFNYDNNQQSKTLIQNTPINNCNIVTGESNNLIVKVEDKENMNDNIIPVVQTDMNIDVTKSTNKFSKAAGGSTFNIFGGESNYNDKVSSIKVACAPGGKSNIVFGSDSSNYEDYRRKR